MSEHSSETGIEPPPPAVVDAAIERALEEDRGSGDLTSAAIAPDVRARARLLSKASGRLAGLGVFARVFELCDPQARIELLSRDGEAIEPGQVLARIEGQARAILLAERTALNFLQQLSGVATLTRRFVEAAGGRARVLDTRKTTPGLRALQKYAVRCGGGRNHRMGLFDEAMVKDNHADLAEQPLAELLAGIRSRVGEGVRIHSEARTEEEALAGVEGGADVVMLDNMSVERMAALCPRLRAAARSRGRPLEIEASGGIALSTIGPVARAGGVDRISVGALTHSAPALDLSLDVEPLR